MSAAPSPWPRFLAFNTPGAVLWVGLWATLGFTAGTRIGEVHAQAARYQIYLVAVLGVLAAAVTARHLARHRRRHASRDGS